MRRCGSFNGGKRGQTKIGLHCELKQRHKGEHRNGAVTWPRKHNLWSASDIGVLRKMYSNTHSQIIADKLGHSISQVYKHANALGLKKSAAFTKKELALQATRLRIVGAAHRFPKGHAPANKGTRRPGYAPGRMAETQFKKGEMAGAAKAKWKPVGTVMADPDGYLRVKVRERADPVGERGWHQNVWPLLSWLNWEKATGKKVPKGYMLVFKDKDRTNCDVSNLELITLAENMRRNTVHNLPAELRDLILLKGAVKRRLRERIERDAEKRDSRPA